MKIGTCDLTWIKSNQLTAFVIFIIFILGLAYAGSWQVQKLTDNSLPEGNFDIDSNHFVWEGYDGNDWEIFYHRPSDRILADRYNLIRNKGCGKLHKKGGITKVGGYRRKPRVCYDYEGLCYFNLENYRGTVEKARLTVYFKPKTCGSSHWKKKYKCSQKYSLSYKFKYGKWYKYGMGSWYNRSYFNYKRKLTLHFFGYKRYYSRNSRSGYFKIYHNKYSRRFIRSYPCLWKCRHRCPPKNRLPKIIVYNENKGPWDKDKVHYNSFNLCPWKDKIGHLRVPNKKVRRLSLKNDNLRELVQSWVDDATLNRGLVLTADFRNRRKYYSISKVVLKITFVEKTMQLTNNEIDDFDPHIDGNKITWGIWDGNDAEVMLWDGSQIKQLTDNDFDEYNAQISGKSVVWEGFNGNQWDIYLWRNNTIKNLSANGYDHYEPRINQGMVTWYGFDGNDDEIFYYDGEETSQITDNVYDDWFPELDDSVITWQGFDGNDTEIFFWDIYADQIVQVTDNMYHDAYPQTDNKQMVWRYYDGLDWEINYWNGTQVVAVTNNTMNDYTPDIYKGQITWSGFDGNDFDIFFYDTNDTSSIELVYDNIDHDFRPRIYGEHIIWTTYECDTSCSTYDFEIYIAWRNQSRIDPKIPVKITLEKHPSLPVIKMLPCEFTAEDRVRIEEMLDLNIEYR